MLNCLKPSSATANQNFHSSPPPLQENSTDGTPRSSSQTSPTFNLVHEYKFAVDSSSYSEIWSKIHRDNSSYQEEGTEQLDDHRQQQLLADVLQPNRDCVQEALQFAKSSTLTRIVSAYFDQSEQSSRLCLLLYQSVRHARCLYYPLHDLLSILPLDSDSNSFTSSQCTRVCEVFIEFDQFENPFPHPDSHNFHDVCYCFSELRQQLDCRLKKSRSRVRLLHHATVGTTICLIGSALVAGPFLPAFLPSKITKKELAHVAQLDAVKRRTFALHKDLDTIDRLVARLHTEVDGDKFRIRLGLESCMDKYFIQEVAKELRKNHTNFQDQLKELEERLCLCFAAINRCRSLLLKEICFHQNHGS